MTVNELKTGDTIYSVKSFQIDVFKYLCISPDGGGKYHILINNFTKDPIRIYESHLAVMLAECLNSYEDAEDALIMQLKRKIEIIQERRKLIIAAQ